MTVEGLQLLDIEGYGDKSLSLILITRREEVATIIAKILVELGNLG